MKMKILAFAASNSRNSINKLLVSHVAKGFSEFETEVIDLNDYEMPIYGVDYEREKGIPERALAFAGKVDESDLLLISFAEYNGSYTTAFKNVFDWISRIPGRKAFGNKPMFLMATSTGARGGVSVLEAAVKRMPHSGGIVLETFVLPSFTQNFIPGNGVVHVEKQRELSEKTARITGQFMVQMH